MKANQLIKKIIMNPRNWTRKKRNKCGEKKVGRGFISACSYHSWERGLNENTNGLVRQFFPKGTDCTKLTHEEVTNIEKNLNNRPQKLLQFRTPHEEFLHLTGREIRLMYFEVESAL